VTVQFQHAPGDKPRNLERVHHLVGEAARGKVEIVAFPEMGLTGCWHLRMLSREAVEALAEPVPEGPAGSPALSAGHGMTIGAGLIERAADGRMFRQGPLQACVDRTNVTCGPLKCPRK
jgi:predicted amidohydrolase